MALVVCKKLRLAGLGVPEDVVVTGFDGILETSYHTPKLTTAMMDAEVVGARIFSILAALFENREVESTCLLPFTMIFSESSTMVFCSSRTLTAASSLLSVLTKFCIWWNSIISTA